MITKGHMQHSAKKIFFVAPSDGESEIRSQFLAGQKKIRYLLQLFASQGYLVSLINSAPVMGSNKKMQIDQMTMLEKITINRLTISSYKQRKIGRLRNVYEAHEVLDKAIKAFGAPDVIWCYNGYSFEMRFARQAANFFNIPVILEFEDWHFARSGPLNPKAILDYILWRRATKFIKFCYAVNPWLASLMQKKGIEVELLPGVINDEVMKINEWSKPVPGGRIKAGYFGGLTVDKGAGFILDLISFAVSQSLPIHFDVTGTGPLKSRYFEVAAKHPDYLAFHGVVGEKKLYQLIEKSHVLLNPHEENKGVLPFKLLEGIAAGRPIISGPLPIQGTKLEWVFSGIKVIDLDLKEWLDSIMNIATSNFFSRQSLTDNRHKAFSLFGRSHLAISFREKINSLLK